MRVFFLSSDFLVAGVAGICHVFAFFHQMRFHLTAPYLDVATNKTHHEVILAFCEEVLL